MTRNRGPLHCAPPNSIILCSTCHARILQTETVQAFFCRKPNGLLVLVQEHNELINEKKAYGQNAGVLLDPQPGNQTPHYPVILVVRLQFVSNLCNFSALCFLDPPVNGFMWVSWKVCRMVLSGFVRGMPESGFILSDVCLLCFANSAVTRFQLSVPAVIKYAKNMLKPAFGAC